MTRYTTWLTVNRQCNLHCYWCYQGDLLLSKDRMSLELANTLVNLSIGMGTQKFILIGGEPTIHPDFLEIVRECRAMEVGLLTNGITLSSRGFCKRVEEAGVTSVAVSLKGASEEDYMNSCGNKHAFGKVMRAIENLERGGMKHHVSITVSHSIATHWEETLRVIRECGASEFAFSFERPVVTAKDVSFDDRMLPHEIVPFIEKTMYPSLKETGKDFSFDVAFPLCHFSPGFLEKAHAEGHTVAACQLLLGNGIIFDPNGRVLACNHMYDHPIGEYGKDFRTLEEMNAWRDSPRIQKFYELASAPPGARCGNCSDWSSCGAGCRIFWLYKGAQVLLPVESIGNRKKGNHGSKLHGAAL